jgi:UDP:flavonoid glycosyltransferase YjiC (YdhE family)
LTTVSRSTFVHVVVKQIYNNQLFMKIGFLSLPLTGHLNPMTALARKIQSRGHEVVFIGVPDIESVGSREHSNHYGYIEADLAVKEQALQKLAPAGKTITRFKAGDARLTFLASL